MPTHVSFNVCSLEKYADADAEKYATGLLQEIKILQLDLFQYTFFFAVRHCTISSNNKTTDLKI